MNQPQAITAPARPAPPRKPRWRNRSWWMRQLHTWHYISAAVSLAAMLLFAVTGFTLNHAASIGATPKVEDCEGQLSHTLLLQLAHPVARDAPLPHAVAQAVASKVHLDPGSHPGEWSESDVYVALPRPGGDAWVSIDRATGRITSEKTDRGWISYLNDLHKGRNAGPAWGWLIDLLAGACVIFSLTGLVLLYFLARNRPLTWPLVAFGIAGPFLVALFLIH